MKDLDFLKIIKSAVKNFEENAKTEIEFVSSSSYIFNAIISGSIFGGMPRNRITALAGEEGTGKTFLAMSIVKSFLEKYEGSNVVWFDTERAVDETFFASRGIDSSRVFIIRPQTLQIVKTQILQIIEGYKNQKDRKPMMMVLDSLGNLPTTKELEDSTEGKEVQDMTRARQVRSIFRVITEPLGEVNVPLLITNHTYEVIGEWVPTQTISGGGGIKYAASTIIYLKKSKDRDQKDKKVVNGIIVKAQADKSRFTKAYKPVEMRIDFTKGLDKYYGLFDLAEKHGVFEKLPSGSYMHPDFPERKLSKMDFAREPEKFYTEEILQKLDKAAIKEFKLGTDEVSSEEIIVEDDTDENVEV